MIVAWDTDHVFLTEAEGDRRFFGGTVRLVGGVNAKARQIAIGKAQFSGRWRGFLTGHRKRMHDPNRRCVVNHAAKLFRQTDPLPEPVHNNCFELCRSGAGAPRHCVDVQRRAENFGQNPRRGASPTEVTEKHRVAPVHHPGKDDAVYVAEYSLERFIFVGSSLGELRANSARLVVRRNTHLFDVFAKICNPVREFMQLFAEFLGRRVTERP